MVIHSIGIIPDGNRRLAKQLMKEPWEGHKKGIGKIYDVLDWCKEAGIKSVIFYALSLENIEKRPKEELKYIFTYISSELKTVLTNPDHLVHKNKIRMHFFGRLHLLPPEMQNLIAEVVQKTRDYREYNAHFALAYGGRQEIVDAAAAVKSPVTEEAFRKHLQTNGTVDPDLIIRTGGERRLSNFLPFQSTYAELAFLDTLWPAFGKEEFMATIADFHERERRFGK